jgi:dTDP-4-dehydrorhamnose 3,5-epimerase
MRFIETNLRGAFRIEPERREDGRGFLARTFCTSEFAAHGLDTQIAQCNVSFNPRSGTLRGMHFQVPPHEEAKLLRCTRGSIYDAIVDLRPDSRTFRQYFGLKLSANTGNMLYIPKGFAHGFLTLEDDTEVFYQMSDAYVPEAGRGVRWDDPAFAIRWPLAVNVISERDRTYPDFSESVLEV